MQEGGSIIILFVVQTLNSSASNSFKSLKKEVSEINKKINNDEKG